MLLSWWTPEFGLLVMRLSCCISTEVKASDVGLGKICVPCIREVFDLDGPGKPKTSSYQSINTTLPFSRYPISNRVFEHSSASKMVYVRQEKLPGLKEYKYSGVDHSLLSRYVLKPFYTNFVIKCFPMSMAPNLITLTGFMFVVVNVLTLLWYSPTLDVDCPRWVYASWAIGLFLYQTFDAVDGSQARRTHQSGPLGELFDHGVDAVNTSLEVLIFAASQNMGMGWKTVLILFGCMFPKQLLF